MIVQNFPFPIVDAVLHSVVDTIDNTDILSRIFYGEDYLAESFHRELWQSQAIIGFTMLRYAKQLNFNDLQLLDCNGESEKIAVYQTRKIGGDTIGTDVMIYEETPREEAPIKTVILTNHTKYVCYE